MIFLKTLEKYCLSTDVKIKNADCKTLPWPFPCEFFAANVQFVITIYKNLKSTGWFI